MMMMMIAQKLLSVCMVSSLRQLFYFWLKWEKSDILHVFISNCHRRWHTAETLQRLDVC